jgi:sec-independent protein translocase protein TatA
MGLSWWHILLVLLVFVLLFGTGKISGLMGDLAKGIKSFKKEMSEGEAEPEPEAKPQQKVIEHKQAPKAVPRKTKSASPAKAAAKPARTRKSS